MKKTVSLAFIIILSLSLIGCGTKDQADIGKIDLYIEVKENFNDGKLNVQVNSNLPDNTQGSITITNDEINYLAQSEIEFKDSKALSEEFSSKGNALDSGTYNIRFVAPLSAFQPKEIQEIIGEDYENIKSEYVVNSEFGTLIDYNKKITIK